MNISIAMASYNGEKYIGEQLDSILDDLEEDDEIILSDDGSTDGTVQIVEEYVRKYSNIKIVIGPQRGVFSNFENAMLHCSNDVIFVIVSADRSFTRGALHNLLGSAL